MDDHLSVAELWSTVREKWTVILVISLTMGVASGVCTLAVVSRSYEAETSLLMAQTGTPSSPLAALAGNLPVPLAGLGISTPGDAVDMYRAIVESRRIRQLVVREFELQRAWDADTEDRAIDRLGRATRVTVDPKARIMKIVIRTDGTPKLARKRPWGPGDEAARKLAADLANAYVRLLREYLRDHVVFQAQRNCEFIELQRDAAKAELAKAETALLGYQENQGIVSIPEETATLLKRSAELETQETAAQLDFTDATQRLHALKSRLLAQAEAGIIDPLPDSKLLVDSARGRLAELEVELAAKSESLAPSNPEIRQLSRQISETKSRLQQELTKVYDAVQDGLVTELIELEVRKTAAEAAKKALEKESAIVDRKLNQLPAEALGIGRLRREFEIQQEVYKLLSSEYERARIEEAKEVIQFEVLDLAAVPTRKCRPSTTLNCLFASFAGLLLAIAYAVAPRRRDPGVVKSALLEDSDSSA